MKTFLNNLSLGSKIALLTSMLVSISILALMFLTIAFERKYYRQELEDQASLLLEIVPFTLLDELYFQSLDELRDVASQIERKDLDVLQYIIYDPTGVILADSNAPRSDFSREIDPFGETLVNLAEEEDFASWEKDQFISGLPVYLESQVIGAVSVRMSTNALDSKISFLVIQSVFLSTIIILFGIGLSFVLSRQITNPLRALTKVSQEMEGGKTSLRVAIESTDEVGRLSTAFNHMAEAIQARETDLRELTASLEKKVAKRTKELRQRNQELTVMAISDPLTKIYNRRHFFALAEKEYLRAQRYQHPLSLVLIDVDYFKEINDTYGHQIGDEMLVNVADFFQKNIRSADIVGRYGGEEFIILMPEISCQYASLIAERLRKCIAETPQVKTNHEIMLTISLGVSCWDSKEDLSFDSLLHRADQALYRSKNDGRNRVTVW